MWRRKLRTLVYWGKGASSRSPHNFKHSSTITHLIRKRSRITDGQEWSRRWYFQSQGSLSMNSFKAAKQPIFSRKQNFLHTHAHSVPPVFSVIVDSLESYWLIEGDRFRLSYSRLKYHPAISGFWGPLLELTTDELRDTASPRFILPESLR